MRKRVLSFLLHPLFLSCIVTIGVVLLFLPPFPKYKAEIIEQKIAKGTEFTLYDDLDGNGYSDRILTAISENGISCVTVTFEPSLFFQEWDLKGKYAFTTDTYLLTGDYDGNKIKELFVFTVSGDSILLNIITDLKNKHPRFLKKFIDKVGKGSETPHLVIVHGEMDDLNQDGFRELIFAVNAGYSLSPRTVYAYDIHNDLLSASPMSGYFINDLLQADITGDGKNEIIVNGYASMNIKDTAILIDDSCCWLMVLDRRLQFLFPPVEFEPRGYSSLQTVAVPNKGNYYDLYSLYAPPLLSEKKSILLQTDSSGRLIKEHEVPDITNEKVSGFYTYTKDHRSYIVIPTGKGKTHLFDTNFIFQQTIPFSGGLRRYWLLDLNGDQRNEMVNLDTQRGNVMIYQNDLSNPVSVNLNLGLVTRTVVSLKQDKCDSPSLFIDSEDHTYLISYGVNPMYCARWAIYPGTFLAIYLFTLLIRKIQRMQIEKKIKTEKKITELQLKIVKNQMDPHFTMNAINSVIAAIQQDRKETASQSLLHFSKMYRSLVLSGDKIKRSLAEEIDFSRNYLELEKFRFKERFDYRMEMDPAVNLNLEVPKMIIQSPVENAVKHGLMNKESGGLLIIRAFERDHQVILEVEDNGIGREKAQQEGSAGTGKGLKIMEEFLELYHKITGVRIQWHVTDLFDDAGKPSGTKVRITIPVIKSQKPEARS